MQLFRVADRLLGQWPTVLTGDLSLLTTKLHTPRPVTRPQGPAAALTGTELPRPEVRTLTQSSWEKTSSWVGKATDVFPSGIRDCVGWGGKA